MEIFNNLGRTRQVLKGHGAEGKKIHFYSCGPTTYDFLHVGNGRALVTGDLFFRVLQVLGFDVTYVRNFTDVDDKIIDRAQILKRDPIEHAQIFIDECLVDMKSLNMLPPNFTPKVSESIPEIIELVKELVLKNVGYIVDGNGKNSFDDKTVMTGEVLYHVPRYPQYGELSLMDLDQLSHGHRVEVKSHKLHPADFVLWKPAKPGEPAWESPWGPGRPGWHIECSAMAKKFLGDTLDLHHGGVDLIFPHHENERAQSEAANGKIFCHQWCHNEFVNFGTEKMSKSLGNIITIRGFVEKFSGQVLRQIFLGSHYRTKVEWSENLVKKSIDEVERIHQFAVQVGFSGEQNFAPAVAVETKLYGKVVEEMKVHLCNDFNTPGALGVLFSFIRQVRRELETLENQKEDIIKSALMVLKFAQFSLGVVTSDPQGQLEKCKLARMSLSGFDGELDNNLSKISDEEIIKLIEQRRIHKEKKEFAQADGIRKKLEESGIKLKDHPNGPTTWES